MNPYAMTPDTKTVRQLVDRCNFDFANQADEDTLVGIVETLVEVAGMRPSADYMGSLSMTDKDGGVWEVVGYGDVVCLQRNVGGGQGEYVWFDAEGPTEAPEGWIPEDY